MQITLTLNRAGRPLRSISHQSSEPFDVEPHPLKRYDVLMCECTHSWTHSYVLARQDCRSAAFDLRITCSWFSCLLLSVRPYVCMFACLYVRMYINVYVCMCMCTYLRVYVCMYVCICALMYRWVYMHHMKVDSRSSTWRKEGPHKHVLGWIKRLRRMFSGRNYFASTREILNFKPYQNISGIYYVGAMQLTWDMTHAFQNQTHLYVCMSVCVSVCEACLTWMCALIWDCYD